MNNVLDLSLELDDFFCPDITITVQCALKIKKNQSINRSINQSAFAQSSVGGDYRRQLVTEFASPVDANKQPS